MARDAFTAPFEPILHATPWRMRWIGLFSLLGHPLFGWIWLVWLPQPWESPLLRVFVALLAVPMVLGIGMGDIAARRTALLFSLICWVQLPVFFSWMYLANSGNTVWLASMVAMILIYYHATDWRLATLGVFFGGLLAYGLFGWLGPDVPALSIVQTRTNAVVLAFAWASALTLGFSSANLRREHLRNTLATVGIMAHELRTPLATIALVGDVMDTESQELEPDAAGRLQKLATRVQTLVRSMNHQIDVQIANARLLHLPLHRETVSASELVQRAVLDYPFRTARERASVTVLVRRDFRFRASPQLFSQVIDNLVKNALKALAAGLTSARPGDITIEVGVLHNRGRILVSDQGVGISAGLAPRIFEPFFSTDTGSGHGLGLAFCRRVVGSLGGSIHLRPSSGKGATFVIELPLLE
ncbi:MAG: HAMP domain-containing histidine kinase [Rubrivivax sp.]|nr:MAG: HAMP domain-containing histidine kinase [Rubrivivax sp.]